MKRSEQITKAITLEPDEPNPLGSMSATGAGPAVCRAIGEELEGVPTDFRITFRKPSECYEAASMLLELGHFMEEQAREALGRSSAS